MNAQTQYPTPYTLDALWLDAIEDELERGSTPSAIEPCVMATYDVMFGRPLAPELYYRTVLECEQYIVVYKAAAQAWAARVEEVNAGVYILSDAEVEMEWANLVEGMLDEEFQRRGGA